MRTLKSSLFWLFLVITVWCYSSQIASASLTCLVGVDAPETRDVTRVKECGPHEVCFLDAYVTPSGYLRHEMGCRDQLQCGGSTVAGDKYVVCTECCHSNDICQPELCGSGGYPTDAGPVCLHCEYPVDSQTSCDTLKECSRDDVCGVNKTDDGRYMIQCMAKDVCENNQVTGTCASCCSSNLCNDNCAPVTRPKTTTPKTTTALLHPVVSTTSTSSPTTVTTTTKPTTTMSTTTPMPTVTTTTKPTTKMSTTTPMPTVNVCLPDTCLNGVCNSIGASYWCQCKLGWTGDRCETRITTTVSTTLPTTTPVNPCISNPCTHGFCNPSSTDGTYGCVCFQGWTGNDCNLILNTVPPTTTPTTTQGSQSHCTCRNGKCVFTAGGGYYCECNPGYVGRHCKALRDCYDVEQQGLAPANDDIYTVIVNNELTRVVCDRHGEGGDGKGWTRILYRHSGIDFNKDSNDYALGFGPEFNWIGLSNLYWMTQDSRGYQLKVKLWGTVGQTIQYYDDFSVGWRRHFTLHVGASHGTAGDGLASQNNAAFITNDPDRQDESFHNCSITRQAGWWYSGCVGTCLTCPVNNLCTGMYWNSPTSSACGTTYQAQMFFKPT